MPGAFFDMTATANEDKRPWEQRGFFEIKPVDAYANQSIAQERTPEFAIKKDGSDPKEGYPERQKASKDSAIGRAGKGNG